MPLSIRPTLEKYVYAVSSESHPHIRYRVDLLANHGAGHCQCVDFGTRRQANIDLGLEACERPTRCKHLQAAHQYFLREILRELSRLESTS